MHFCYVDESGCTGALPSPRSSVQPVLAIGGVIIDKDALHPLTHEFLDLKRRFFPRRLPRGRPYLHWILPEVKGADLRRNMRTGGRNVRRHTLGYLDGVMDLLKRHGARIVARVWIKEPGGRFDGRAVYTSSIQSVTTFFHHHLSQHDRQGALILDSRTKRQNTQVSFSIFTQKYQTAGDSYPRMLEMPTFGHSENHVGIQLADVVCSTWLFPMATFTYCTGHVQSVHVQARFGELRERFGDDLKKLQYRYQDAGRWYGGISVSDAIARRSGGLLFG